MRCRETLGPDALDISHLVPRPWVFTYDPGFMATASTESKITYIDGDAGVLLYRGYPSNSSPHNRVSWRSPIY